MTCGTTEPDKVSRPKISRVLAENPNLAAQIASGRTSDPSGSLLWAPAPERVARIVKKLAQGHAAFELSLPVLGDPDEIGWCPLISLPDEHVDEFLAPPGRALWPEIGSRAFIHAAKHFREPVFSNWQVVQSGRYQYCVSQDSGTSVKFLIRGYLACQVFWW